MKECSSSLMLGKIPYRSTFVRTDAIRIFLNVQTYSPQAGIKWTTDTPAKALSANDATKSKTHHHLNETLHLLTQLHPECLEAWSTDASSHPFFITLLHLVPNILLALFPYAYYQQLTSSNPNTLSSAIPLNGYPDAHYTPLYNSSASVHRSASHIQPSPRHLSVVPVSEPLSPGPPSFNVTPEGGYMAYDNAEPEDRFR
jgi:hypothetical protein